jgi:hypothetical protein
MRTHRTPLQRVLSSDVFRCRKCGASVHRLYRTLSVNTTFFFSRYTHCIRCGTPDIQRSHKRDRVDSFSRHLASRIMRFTGAPINKCAACRLQYYDWRPVRSDDQHL